MLKIKVFLLIAKKNNLYLFSYYDTCVFVELVILIKHNFIAFTYDGYIKEFLTSYMVGCSDGFYGKDCSLECSEDCDNKNCDTRDGNCTSGCTSLYEGPKCDKKVE